MGNDIEHGEVVDKNDRPLTGVEKQRLARGHDLAVGNGERKSFAELSPETLRQYQAKALETRRLNAAAKKLEEQAAYLAAHREHAATIMGGKLAIIEGLLTEMTDPATGKPDTRRLDEKRLKLLQQTLTEWEKASGMQPGKSADGAQQLNVNVTHTVSRIIDRLGDGA